MLLLGCLALAVTLLWAASSAKARVATPAPRGNARGLALLRRVHAAYRNVPAVQLSAHSGTVQTRFRLLLRAGVATAEDYFATVPGGTVRLVARGSGPTYARELGSSCWRRLEPNAQQTLEDVGIRFPDAYRTVVKAPRRAGASWLLPTVAYGRSAGEKAAVTLRIDASTMLVESETAMIEGQRLTQHVKELRHRPSLPVPKPAC